MKRVRVALITLLFAVSLPALAFAAAPAPYGGDPGKPMAPAEKPGEAPKSTAPAEKPGEKPMTEKPAGEKEAKGKEAKGKIVSVNKSRKTLVLDMNGKKMTFTLAESAAKELANLKRGDDVTVRYTEKGKKLTAQDVTKG